MQPPDTTLGNLEEIGTETLLTNRPHEAWGSWDGFLYQTLKRFRGVSQRVSLPS